MKVAVTDYTFDALDVETDVLKPLGHEVVGQKIGKDPQQLIPLVKDADCVITQFAPVNAAVIAAMQKCRAIVRYGIGVDNVDLAAAAAKGIPVCNVPDYCIDEVADYALAMILDLARKITVNAVKVRSGELGLGRAAGKRYFCLKDMTVGVVGFGRIGREVVARLKAFKCKILVYDPPVDAAVIAAAGLHAGLARRAVSHERPDDAALPEQRPDEIDDQCPEHLPMKPGVMLVNTSRGTLVKTDDLVAALQSGQRFRGGDGRGRSGAAPARAIRW